MFLALTVVYHKIQMLVLLQYQGDRGSLVIFGGMLKNLDGGGRVIYYEL